MSYSEKTVKVGDMELTTVQISCDAQKGKDRCGNSAEVTMSKPFDPKRFLLGLGWGLLRGHQVCGACRRSGRKITFSRGTARKPQRAAHQERQVPA